MTSLDWARFETLSGAATHKFEMLWRSAVRRHYGSRGRFRALSNQAGVEFDLHLTESIPGLANKGDVVGWQCKWYESPKGKNLGKNRRLAIIDSLKKTRKYFPEITHWVLCTRHPLTSSDTKWFLALKYGVKLMTWSSAELDEHLHGEGELLRETYFGAIAVSDTELSQQHRISVAPVRERWIPEVHQVSEVEDELTEQLDPLDWAAAGISKLVTRIGLDVQRLEGVSSSNRPRVADDLLNSSKELLQHLSFTEAAAQRGDVEGVRRILDLHLKNYRELDQARRKLYREANGCSLLFTNLLGAAVALGRMKVEFGRKLERRVFAVAGEAGFGKTQLAAQLTQSTAVRPAGVLLLANEMPSKGSLDDLARRVHLKGQATNSFERLVAALNAAGERGGYVLPIVVDGLNESEDPRNWKAELLRANTLLEDYQYVRLIVTIRTSFLADAVPSSIRTFRLWGFVHTEDAVSAYFSHYKIRAQPWSVPIGFLTHPLKLRIFCEVANQSRFAEVDISAVPRNLDELFGPYLQQVSSQIASQTSGSLQKTADEVLRAIFTVGLLLWNNKARQVEFDVLRSYLNDQGVPWPNSLVRAMEDAGLLLRDAGVGSGESRYQFAFDALAGFVLARAFMDTVTWPPNPQIRSQLVGGGAHPLAGDILNSLSFLLPDQGGPHVWTWLRGAARRRALISSSALPGRLVDDDTKKELKDLLIRHPADALRVWDELRTTKSIVGHPLNAWFLSDTLQKISTADRDRTWSEWIRGRWHDILREVLELEKHWQKGSFQAKDKLDALWVMWTLTTTVRLLRDRSTRALTVLARRQPDWVFDLCNESFDILDLYIPERMLAACYGAVMSEWAAPEGDRLRAALPAFAQCLMKDVFSSGGKFTSPHCLARESALGILQISERVHPGCTGGKLPEPSAGVLFPFKASRSVINRDTKSPLGMDFLNYTIGAMVEGRRNYDFSHKRYAAIAALIEDRITSLGYSDGLFSEIERSIGAYEARGAHASGVQSKVDRYGKKYGWIAYFEMFGTLGLRRKLPSRMQGIRNSNVDLDPSFPVEPVKVNLDFDSQVTRLGGSDRAWLTKGRVPDYLNLLMRPVVDQVKGPWTLLNGNLNEQDSKNERQTFAFLRGLLVRPERVRQVLDIFLSIEYPGNQLVPEPHSEFYTYAGEIPWSMRFGGGDVYVPDAKRTIQDEALSWYDGTQWCSIPVEVPVHRFAWESHHSQLNQVSGIEVPSAAICERFRLVNRPETFDLFTPSGDRASLSCRLTGDSELTYLRTDLLVDYIRSQGLCLLWLIWGERTINVEGRGLPHRDVLSAHGNIFRYYDILGI